MVLYNLWEDDQGQLELDFDADQYLPPDFKIVLQGHEVQHHRLVDDPICPHEPTCRPQGGVEHVMTERVLEVNFVQPAHDKQGIECTTILARQTIARRWGMQAIRAVSRVYHLHLQGKWGVTTRR
ncbi:unnamed protein product [Sphagnum jensenii]|uniref:Uncharacterized protein n=1 Tax=Sphagnum jensenii TaxID=128206 RepID=A0ABP0W813_9BRYO